MLNSVSIQLDGVVSILALQELSTELSLFNSVGTNQKTTTARALLNRVSIQLDGVVSILPLQGHC